MRRKKTDEVPVRVLKRASCPTLSGKSSIAYEAGVTDAGELRIRVAANSGSGTWSDEWVALEAIRKALDRVPRGETVTADALYPLFKGSSANSPFFLAAALKHAGVLVPSETEKRRYERAEPTAFLEELKELMEGKAPATAKAKKKVSARPKPEVYPEKPSASSKKRKAKG